MKLTVNRSSFAFCFLFVGGCCRWIFNGVFGSLALQLVVLFIGLGLFVLSGVFKFNNSSCILLLYLIGIAISLMVNGASGNSVYYFLIVIVITIFSLFISSNIRTYKGLIKACVIYGVINALFVFIQVFLGEAFNNLLYSFFTQSAITTAQYYYSHGNYFGFNFTPADAAGFIALAVFALIFWWVLTKYRNKVRTLIGIVILIAALFITGKRGILFVSIISFIFVMVFIYTGKKQFGRALAFLVGTIVFLLLAYLFIINNQDVAIFYRINNFFNNLMLGEGFDSGRLTLWGYALSLWKSNPIFGIGWRGFSAFSENIFTRTHEVNCDYLQILCENGIVGLILFLIPIIFMLRRAIKVCRNVDNSCTNTQEKWIVMIACFIQFFIVLYAWIEIPFYDVTFYTLYIISSMIINVAYKKLYNRNEQLREVLLDKNIELDSPNVLTS